MTEEEKGIEYISPTGPKLSDRQVSALSMGGLAFILTGLTCVVGLVMYFIYQVVGYEKRFQPFMQSEMAQNISAEYLATGMVDHYLSIFIVPIVLLACAILCSFIGYLLLRTAGAAFKEVIPRQDYELLSRLLLNQPNKGIDHYVRLSSLTGLTGVFTKVGLTGLPLATISLTIIFTALSIFSDQFFDLAKLTLGAFIGSYVQKRAEISEELIRARGREDDS
jgi:hypothetical protein